MERLEREREEARRDDGREVPRIIASYVVLGGRSWT